MPGSVAPTPRLASGPSPPPMTTSPKRSVVGHEPRELARLDARDAQRLLVPLQRLQRHQTGAGRARVVHHPLARQPVHDEVLQCRPAMRGDALVGEPRQLGQRGHRVDRRPGARVQLRVLALDALGLLERVQVGPLQQRRAGAVALVEPDQGVHGARQPDRPVGHQLAARPSTTPSAAASGPYSRSRAVAHLAVGVERRDLGARRPDVEPVDGHTNRLRISTPAKPTTEMIVSITDHVLMRVLHAHPEVLVDQPEAGVVDVGEEQRAGADRQHQQLRRRRAGEPGDDARRGDRRHRRRPGREPDQHGHAPGEDQRRRSTCSRRPWRSRR